MSRAETLGTGGRFSGYRSPWFGSCTCHNRQAHVGDVAHSGVLAHVPDSCHGRRFVGEGARGGHHCTVRTCDSEPEVRVFVVEEFEYSCHGSPPGTAAVAGLGTCRQNDSTTLGCHPDGLTDAKDFNRGHVGEPNAPLRQRYAAHQLLVSRTFPHHEPRLPSGTQDAVLRTVWIRPKLGTEAGSFV